MAEIITPEMAEEILREKSSNERPIKERHVLRLASDISNNRWKDFNGETIKFDNKGKLLDGQHRLLAVIRAKKSIRTYVALGLKEDDIYFIDMGRLTRKVADVFAMKQVENYIIAASAASNLWRYDNDVIQDNSIYPDAQESYLYYLQNEGIQNSIKYGEMVRQLIGKSIATFLHYLFSRIDKNAADIFYEQFATGANLEREDPILLLRNRLEYNKRKDVQMKLDRIKQIALVILAWNARRENKKLTQLRWSTKEFPKAI